MKKTEKNAVLVNAETANSLALRKARLADAEGKYIENTSVENYNAVRKAKKALAQYELKHYFKLFISAYDNAFQRALASGKTKYVADLWHAQNAEKMEKMKYEYTFFKNKKGRKMSVYSMQQYALEKYMEKNKLAVYGEFCKKNNRYVFCQIVYKKGDESVVNYENVSKSENLQNFTDEELEKMLADWSIDA